MNLTRKGFFGTLAAAIFGTPFAAKAVAETLKVGDTFTMASSFRLHPSTFADVQTIKTEALRFHPDSFKSVYPPIRIGEIHYRPHAPALHRETRLPE